jgi:hypothetical protein
MHTLNGHWYDHLLAHTYMTFRQFMRFLETSFMERTNHLKA